VKVATRPTDGRIKVNPESAAWAVAARIMGAENPRYMYAIC
jgi:hypothetical protein